MLEPGAVPAISIATSNAKDVKHSEGKGEVPGPRAVAPDSSSVYKDFRSALEESRAFLFNTKAAPIRFNS